MQIQRVFLFIFLSLMISACSYPMEQLGFFKTSVLGKISTLSQFGDKNVDFSVVKSTALSTCLECHSAGKRAMATEELAFEQRTEILETIRNGSMPPKASGYQSMSECDRKILETWIDDKTQGRAPAVKVRELSACGNIQAPIQKPKIDFAVLELNFENVKREIIAPKCLSCHAKDSDGYQYALEDLQNIKDNDLIAGTADESDLYNVLIPGRKKYFMPPKKSGIPALSVDEADFIKRWIDSGAN